ncbi:uncharacterized protein Z520_02936 [Fonsecaea multimorphosa CBS 102226]|uniref:Uncharacterized protein n=1 Tax=Fonsecaea multimorphosa CBS 102226 TaxID=1442371 RepID=A0A0D2KX38_9EURO|nr:uncharacterized protein Z520_02936 [Fonsecaea multimorphosa CBS 102226]KIY01384.1 hypothetical protein Z520_02936 [Fonsecaea multimorphosa CBS 102226]OAL28400.1 hypothetical protein AYO22_02854 [Fonsecaea multimorphosa]
MAQSQLQRPNLLNAVLDAAGGLDHFNQIEWVEVVADVSGAFWAKKGYPNRRLMTAYVDVHKPRAVFYNFGAHLDEPHLRWIWTPKHLSVERPNGSVILSRSDPYKHFAGHVLTTPWDDLDLLYFTGYALWNYIVTPFYFTWPGILTRELDDYHHTTEAGGGDETWRVLEVTHPADFATHCRVQKFYFDPRSYRLRRLDYTVDVVGDSGPMAHYVYDEKKVGGILFPTLRRALNVVDGRPTGWSAVLINFHKISVKTPDAARPSL